MSRIVSFRGLIADGEQDTVVLHTTDGSTGYRIVNFQIISATPVTAGAAEHVVQIWKIKQATPSTTVVDIDFSNQVLLGAATWSGSDNPVYQSHQQVIFDREVFNQDIYITHTNTDGSAAVNYYMELEQIKLDLNENTVATLKDIRNQA
jgi:hypothetical protein